MTDLATTADTPAAFGRHERKKGPATATLVALNILMLLAVVAVLWTPAVLFWTALLLAPSAIVAIIAITLGLWM